MAYDLSDYVDVAERVQKFHEEYPDGSLQSDWRLAEFDGKQTIIVKAYAYRHPADTKPGIGHASEPIPGLTKFTKGSELMVGETSAWGRALAALGFEVKRGIASREEVMNRSEADGGGKPEPDAAPMGFASAKQEGFFNRLLKEQGLTSDQVEGINRFMETLPKERVKKAIDGVKDGDDPTLEALVVEADKFAKAQSDVPYDETA